MRITIDNLDGHGPVDYSGVIAPEGPVTVQRALNKPSRCAAELVVGAAGLPLPARRARVRVTSNNGDTLFTGYLATEPVRTCVGVATEGPVYRARLSAVSDEWLLDNLGSGSSVYGVSSFGLTGQGLIARLDERIAGAAASDVVAGSGTQLATGSFTPGSTAPFSRNAGLAASAAYGSYRMVNGQLLLQPAGGVTHNLSDADGSIAIAELQTANVRELANDVTLSGEQEPAAYLAECFIGDGTTTVFPLREAAYRDAHRVLAADSFNQSTVDASQWTVSDPGSHLSLTAAGLTLNGGNGNDGQTTIVAADAVEMGGSIVAQLGGVIIGAASDGMLAGMYAGTPLLANCFAGFRVRQNSGNTVLVPVVNGVEAGAVFTPVASHSYTLRLRLHCVERQRVMQRFYCMVDGVVQGFGSASGVPAPMDVVFDLIDEGAAANTPATVLYDSVAAGSAIATTPATCQFAVANSTQLFGSVASVSLSRPGSIWVTSTLPGGGSETRLIGASGQGVDCIASYGTDAGMQAGTPGNVTFLAGRVPVAGERVTVCYRGQQRAVARLQNAASVASEAASGSPGTARWLGKVLQPAARSTADCESAAQAVLAFATSRTAAIAGTYNAVNPTQDIWPGDILAITTDGVTSSLLVRSVTAKDRHAQPEIIDYQIAFANDWAADWADGIGLKLSEEIAANALLPPTAASAPAQVLPNLQQLRITSLTTSTLQLDAGIDPPADGGFEVRRGDNRFGVGVDATDLVLRSPVRAFSIPRASQLEQFYVRMYDASNPPLYSRFSSAVFVNAPVS